MYTPTYQQWLFHLGGRAMAHGPLVFVLIFILIFQNGTIKISFNQHIFV